MTARAAARLRKVSRVGNHGEYQVLVGAVSVGHVVTDETRWWHALPADGTDGGVFARRREAVAAVVKRAKTPA